MSVAEPIPDSLTNCNEFRADLSSPPRDSISYLEPREIALPSRQARLKEQFGFDCTCRLCEDSANASGSAKLLEAFVDRDKGVGIENKASEAVGDAGASGRQGEHIAEQGDRGKKGGTEDGAWKAEKGQGEQEVLPPSDDSNGDSDEEDVLNTHGEDMQLTKF